MPPLEGKGLKILTSNKLLTSFPILLTQIKAENNSYKLKNEIRQILQSWTKLLRQYRGGRVGGWYREQFVIWKIRKNWRNVKFNSKLKKRKVCLEMYLGSFVLIAFSLVCLSYQFDKLFGSFVDFLFIRSFEKKGIWQFGIWKIESFLEFTVFSTFVSTSFVQGCKKNHIITSCIQSKKNHN